MSGLAPPPIQATVLDRRTGLLTRPWLQWFQSLHLRSGGTTAATLAELQAQRYLVQAPSGVLTEERVVTDTPTVTWDFSTAGQAKADLVSVPSHEHEAGDITDFVEAAQDAVGLALANSATVALTYDDALGDIMAMVLADSITFALMQNIATQRLLGRSTAGSGDVEELTIGDGLTLNSGVLGAAHGGQLMQCPGFHPADLVSTFTLPSGFSHAVYLGICPKASSTVELRYRVTTAAVTVTHAEVAIFSGSPVHGGGPTLTRLGFTDVSSVVTATGLKASSVTLSPAVTAGTPLWAVFGHSATTQAIVRAGLADDLQSGYLASRAGRPSTMTSPAAWTLAQTTTALLWCTGFVS